MKVCILVISILLVGADAVSLRFSMLFDANLGLLKVMSLTFHFVVFKLLLLVVRKKFESISRLFSHTESSSSSSSSSSSTSTNGVPSFQVDPFITRPKLISAHTKWLYCSSAFWVLKDQCETTQKFVPYGYWFETGRATPEGTDCKALTGDGDVTVVKTCRVKKGLTMVLPVVNTPYIACDFDTGELEDPRLGPSLLWEFRACNYHTVHNATLDGKSIDSLDLVTVATQDGDMNQRLSGDPTCNDYNDFLRYKDCPVGGVGPNVFIDTSKLTKGKHELLLIGSGGTTCSAVKHEFTLV
jgi:hypothetical protein